MKILSSIFFLSLILCGCFNDPEQEIFKAAESEWKEKRYNNSIEQYKTLIQKFKDGKHTDEALLRLGDIFRLNLDQPQEALVYFYRLAQDGKDKNKRIAQESIANIYNNELRDYDQAIIEYQKLIHMVSDPKDKEKNQYNIASCYFKKGDYVQAVTEFEILLKEYPRSEFAEDAAFQRLNCFFILGSCEKAIQGYNKFLEDFPDSKFSFEAKYSIASCLEEKEDLAGALVVYKSIQGSHSNSKLVELKISGMEERLKKRRR